VDTALGQLPAQENNNNIVLMRELAEHKDINAEGFDIYTYTGGSCWKRSVERVNKSDPSRQAAGQILIQMAAHSRSNTRPQLEQQKHLHK